MKKAIDKLYDNEILPRKTFNCGCYFDKNGKIDYSSCTMTKYTDGKNVDVDGWGRHEYREIEHGLAASKILKSHPAYSNGDSNCVDSKGNNFTGRKCVEKNSKEYERIISDLNILYVMGGHKNGDRSDKDMKKISKEWKKFGCDFKVSKYYFDPAMEKRGDIARMKLYVDMTYPEFFQLSDEYREKLEGFAKNDPISPEEAEMYAAKLETQ